MDLAHVLTDAVVAKAIGAALSVIFLAGAWQKLRDHELFQAAVENYQLVPEAWASSIAMGIPVLELAVGVLLLTPIRTIGVLLAGSLLLVVTSAVAINLLRGRADIDCGCGGLSAHVGEQTLSWGLVARNVLLLAALLATLPDAEPSRALVWIDYFSTAGTTLALLGLYVSANQLMANHPRLQSLRIR
jgi:hypothetical protein